MEGNHLQRQVAYTRRSLFEQGYLDEQFIQLEDLQDDANPNFVEEIVTLFYTDSARLLRTIEQALEHNPSDFDRLDDYMHQFKGSSSRCMRTFQQVKQEHATLRRKLETYFQLAREAHPV
ncbi:pseudo histidine-containing phosphotransfer protein 5-like isoform X2 [Diospyros lotus]|uniref:pseudo histidine-containing phosphotransfer protein 5-like isoform X2 n=1 Tax=Diospyros lotus TaxID=55363 RepID=UPI00224D65C2|nr:pseudo histidine-containing phosphotransfer protein 5-like isoform X2 [Diospyros lotus]